MPSKDVKVFATIALLGVCIIATVWVRGLESFLANVPQALNPMDSVKDHDNVDSSSPLANAAVETILQTASPIFGEYSNTQSSTSTWMSKYPDDTMLVHMNIPGAHDAATWNYSRTTKEALEPVVGVVSDVSRPSEWFRCQGIENGLVGMLNAGIRAFDLRYAQDVTNTTLVFWHGSALQSQSATVEAVMFGFYQWLDDHSSETVLLSFQYEGNKAVQNVDTEKVQSQLHDILTSPATKQYVMQRRDALGTLGSARGKIILLRRFDLNLLPSSYEATIPGLHFSPQDWTVNSPTIELVYNASPSGNADNEEEGTAYIEDYYHPVFLSASSTLAENIDIKFNATKAHLLAAAGDEHPNGLFWAFASGTNTDNEPIAVTPKLMAVGGGVEGGIEGGGEVEGVNQRLLKLFKEDRMKGKRLGIVMFDFFEVPGPELVGTFLGLRRP